MSLTHSTAGGHAQRDRTRKKNDVGERGGEKTEAREFLIIDKNVCTRVASQKRGSGAMVFYEATRVRARRGLDGGFVG